LALGGGGARGLATVGVLGVLEREGVPVDCIAGTSVGALIGAVYAGGIRGDRLLDLARRIGWKDLARPAWPGNGLLSFARLERFLDELLAEPTFDDLELPYAAVTTDLITGQAVIQRRGRVAPAVRASCSIPTLVTPLELDGRLLVDGAIANNLPISVARELGAEVVIAVNLHTPPKVATRGGLKIGVAAVEHLLLNAGDPPETADVFLSIPFWGVRSVLRLSDKERLLALGRQAAEAALPAIRAVIE
jgi:NTE family protein